MFCVCKQTWCADTFGAQGMLADIMSALYLALDTALVAHQSQEARGVARGGETDADAGRDSQQSADALAAEHAAEVSSIFKSERLIFTGGRSGSGGACARNGRGAGQDGAVVPRGWMGATSDGALVPGGWIEAAAEHPPPQPLLVRAADCIWGESVAGAVLGLFPLRTLFASMRPFFVQVLGVAVLNVQLSFRALRAVVDTPWPLVQDRLAVIASSQPQSNIAASSLDASLALFREIEDLLTTFHSPKETADETSSARGMGIGGKGREDHCGGARPSVQGGYARGCSGCSRRECAAAQVLRVHRSRAHMCVRVCVRVYVYSPTHLHTHTHTHTSLRLSLSLSLTSLRALCVIVRLCTCGRASGRARVRNDRMISMVSWSCRKLQTRKT